MALILASTLLLLRDRNEQLEVFLAVRNKKVSFVPGTLVFRFLAHCDIAH